MPSENYFLKILSWAIPFLLGLFASLIIDKIRAIRTNVKNRKFVEFYLLNTTLNSLTKLKSDYITIKERIESNKRLQSVSVSAHEDFNANVLHGITYVQYYNAYKEKYVLVNEIITMIEYMSTFLPGKLIEDYWEVINQHLDKKQLVGNWEHVQTCDYCKQKKEEFVGTISNRINECEILKERIEQLIK